MTHPRDESVLDDVLHEYASCPGGPSHSTLTEWVKSYPEFRKELEEFTAAWILQETLPPQQPEVVDEETLVLRAMSAVQQVLYEERPDRAADCDPAAADDAPDLDSLMAAGRELGLDARTLAESCELSVPLIAKLDRRLIAFASVPLQLSERLAEVLRTGTAAVQAYLRQPMVLAEGARYRSSSRPALPTEQQDFFEAVRADPTLSADRRKHWLDLTPPPENWTEP